MKVLRSIQASWSGVFSPKYIMDNSEISDRSEAKKLSDYLYEEGVDSGWDNRYDCLQFLEKYRGGFDGLYEEMKQKNRRDTMK